MDKRKYEYKDLELGLQSITEKKTGKLIAYRGYSHRAGCSFKIGDKLFDEKWKMSKAHTDYIKYKKKMDKSEYCENVEEVIPFTERGSVVITSMEQAKKAAKNFSKYVS